MVMPGCNFLAHMTTSNVRGTLLQGQTTQPDLCDCHPMSFHTLKKVIDVSVLLATLHEWSSWAQSCAPITLAAYSATPLLHIVLNCFCSTEMAQGCRARSLEHFVVTRLTCSFLILNTSHPLKTSTHPQ